ncbi:AzlD domain-containing protein [Ferrovibrio terrae]|uniref:AzlD domain-containing protein n=1 Tax=Ferrovibrio terrae TaxID=2594003 RepID=A0A516H5G3_9PROT|nr:AzlD domain-containing protein [Ferrovibrio terrae]QDO99043.1 AzlD domain-containing protein [Ferrovibrio terrae]
MIEGLTTFDTAAVIAILGMGIVTYATRAGGFWLMGYVTLSPKLERFLRQTAGGVLVAIVVAAVVKGDPAMWAGLAAAIGIMIAIRKSMTAISIGMIVAVAIRYFV